MATVSEVLWDGKQIDRETLADVVRLGQSSTEGFDLAEAWSIAQALGEELEAAWTKATQEREAVLGILDTYIKGCGRNLLVGCPENYMRQAAEELRRQVVKAYYP